MSHGGMGGGGGHGHGGGFGGHGHHGHHGHHGAMAGHHADQSPAWNMAMQVEKDTTRRLRIADPRFLVALTLVVFVTLITLPYTMDYLQNQKYAAQGKMEALPEADSSGPSSAALAMVGATLTGHKVELPENVAGAIGAPEAASGAQNHGAGNAERADNAERIEAPDAYGSAQICEQSANDTVSQMAAASGIAPGGAGVPPASSAGFAAPRAVQQQQQIPQMPAPMPAYGGAMPTNQQYYVYVPGQQQQFGQPAAVPGANLMAPQQQLPAMAMAQPAAVPVIPAPDGGVPRQSLDQRSPFNPQTSAIVSPMGMRHHGSSPTMPMLPSSSGADGSHRMRVWVGR